MFVGHYGPSFALQRVERRVPLWLLFIAVQFVDILWAVLILLGIEKVRVIAGFTETNADARLPASSSSRSLRRV